VCLSPTLQKTLVLPHLREDEVTRCLDARLDASGKGVNVTRVLHQLGATVTHVTQLGGAFRPKFLELCAKDALSLSWVESNAEIRFCYTLLNQAFHTSTEIVEESPAVDPSVEAAIMAAYEAALTGARAVVISGSKAAGFSDALYPNMVRVAKERGLLVVLDYRKTDLLNSMQYRPDVIKPNLTEFLETFLPDHTSSESSDTLDAVKARMRALHQESGSLVVVTRGANPTLYTDANGTVQSLASEAITPVNTIGCGDALTAGLTAALAAGRSPAEAVALGHRCAALNARNLRPGTLR
jgi:1-phosphofructokinase family hexose kinase